MSACGPTAASPTPRTADCGGGGSADERLFAVAVSGGPDSVALLHCCTRVAHALGLRVLALHVHHGLQADADDWLRQVRAQARRWGARFDSRRLTGSPAAGESVEAWARRERYRALGEMARAAGAGLVLLAHHRRDQAETFVLQALRGAGARGLAAMPSQARRDGLVWARPWLQQPRSAIEHYGQRHRLKVAEDASNADPRFQRSRLRHQVWPALLQAFPQAEQALAASCLQAQHAAALAQACALEDLPRCTDGQGLVVAAWLALPPARRRNALQAWLARVLPAGAPVSLLERLLEGLVAASQRSNWCVPAPGGCLRLHRGVLVPALEIPAPPQATGREPPMASGWRPAGTPAREAPEESGASGAPGWLQLSAPGSYALPGWPGGCLVVQRCSERGVLAARLERVQCRARAGSDRFQREPGTPPRRLKLQYQAAGVPAWARQGPLLQDAAGALLFVSGLGVDARAFAAPGQPQLCLRWEPD